MDQRGDRIGLALIGVAAACLWVGLTAACRAWTRRPGSMPLLALAALAAVYLCVPETDQLKGVALLVLGVAALELASSETLPFVWHGLLVVTVLWAGLWGAQTRHSAIVGAVFAGWVFALPAITSRLTHSTSLSGRAAVCGAAAAAALVMARTGGLAHSTRTALGWAAVVAGASLVSAVPWVVADRRRRPSPR